MMYCYHHGTGYSTNETFHSYSTLHAIRIFCMIFMALLSRAFRMFWSNVGGHKFWSIDPIFFYRKRKSSQLLTELRGPPALEALLSVYATHEILNTIFFPSSTAQCIQVSSGRNTKAFGLFSHRCRVFLHTYCTSI